MKEDSDVVAKDGTSLDALGLRWTPAVSGLSWELLPKFIDKLREGLTMTAKEAASCIGLVSWGRYATTQDICDLHGCYRSGMGRPWTDETIRPCL